MTDFQYKDKGDFKFGSRCYYINPLTNRLGHFYLFPFLCSKNHACLRSILVKVGTFDLGDSTVYNQVKADYNLVRHTIKTKGFDSLTGKMRVLVQPRTKGPGHGSTSRAFYARKVFVEHVLSLSKRVG